MSESINRELFDLLAKKLAGEASCVEEAFLKKIVDSSDEGKKVVSNLHHVWSSQQFSNESSELVSQREINEKIWQNAFETKSFKNRKYGSSIVLRIAATLIIFLSAIFVIVNMVDKPQKTETQVTLINKQTLPGQKSSITLRDGTIVWLNSGSSISYHSNFNDSIRIITLKGQAFFEVFKDKTKPFIVKCRDLEIEALGTSFDVNGYSDTPIQVSLLTGQVKLTVSKSTDNEEEVFLAPGEYSILGNDNTFIERGVFSPYEVLAWKEGRLIFDNATISEIIPKLELWYGVHFNNKLTINQFKPFTSVFERENLDNILINIGDVLQFDHVIEGNEIIIKN